MKHREAEIVLDSFVRGEVDQDQADLVRRHLEKCADCREWVETFSQLALIVDDEVVNHLTSDDLARFAVEASHASGALADPRARHLDVCFTCREEFNLAVGALREARRLDESVSFLLRKVISPRSQPVFEWSLAAAAVLAIVLVLPLVSRLVGQGPESDIVISGKVLDGPQVVMTAGQVRAENSEVGKNGDLILRAGRGVVLGEGFRVAVDGRLQVESFAEE
jgi:anti-sigma factor RsiW